MLKRSWALSVCFTLNLLAYDPNPDLEAGRFLKTLSEAESELKSNPKNAMAWAAKSQALCAMQRFQDAMSAAQQSLSLNPSLPEARLARGMAEAATAIQQRNFSSLSHARRAMDDFRAATQANPKLERGWITLGLAYQQLPGILGGSTKKALECADNLKKQNLPRGESLTGTLYVLDSNWPKARESFQRALQLAPKNAEIIYAYLDALGQEETRDQLGIDQQKKLLSQEAKRLLPHVGNNAKGLESICDALLDAGEAEAAWQVAKEALPKADAPSLVRLQMGKLAARSGLHKEEALALLNQAVKEPMEGGSGGYPAAFWRRGQILHALGRKEEARASAQEALKWDNKHPGAKRLLKELK